MAADREEPLMSHSTLGKRRLGDTQNVENPSMSTSAKRTAMTASSYIFHENVLTVVQPGLMVSNPEEET